MNSQPTNQPPELPNYLNDLCAVCGGRRGLHNFHNQRCPKDINSSGDHTEYRNTVFTATPPTVIQPLQWVSIEVAVPEKSGLVLGVMRDTKNIYVCYYKKSRNVFQVWGAGKDPIEDMHVTHWMPMPPAPGESTPPNQLSGIEVKERIKIVTDKQLDKAWGYANFGDTPKRKVILEALEKITQGYHNGSTATAIVKELKLIEQRNRNYVLTDKGLKYLLAGYAASEGEKDLIIQGLEEGSELWKAEYDNCRAILTELVYLKTLKDTKGKTEEYEQRQPLVWITAKKFLEKYQHQ